MLVTPTQATMGKGMGGANFPVCRAAAEPIPQPTPPNLATCPQPLIALISQLPPHPTSHCRTFSHSRAQYPKWVWSPAGGWWCNPPNWKRNTAICGAVWGVCLFFTARFSMENERRPLAPMSYPMPSQFWCKHAVADDPRLAAMGWPDATKE